MTQDIDLGSIGSDKEAEACLADIFGQLSDKDRIIAWLTDRGFRVNTLRDINIHVAKSSGYPDGLTSIVASWDVRENGEPFRRGGAADSTSGYGVSVATTLTPDGSVVDVSITRSRN